IDIMEMVGGSGGEDTVYGTAHWDNEGAAAQYGGSTKLPPGQTLDSSFHVFSLTWDENQLNWYVDDILYHTMDIDDSPGLAAFREEFFLIVNVAVGGDWPGPPNANTEFPQHMLVDYIRVFQAN
ncbi:MAG: glycoside hydrolase family 16 protein, partial [Pseudomonadales bacterium]